jgi:hypothetical protein
VFGPTKTHATRKLPLPPSLAAAFERHLDERVDAATDALFFTSPKGKPLRYGKHLSDPGAVQEVCDENLAKDSDRQAMKLRAGPTGH